MDFGLAGKTAIVAAASEGLGRASAISLAKEGANVVICGRRKEKVEETAKEISQETGSKVLAVKADVGSYSDIRSFIGKAVESFGRIDVLVTNCGGPRFGIFEDFSDEDWQGVFETVFLSVVRLCREVLPHMKKNGGSIINIASYSAKEPVEGLVLSNSMRLAVIGLAKTLANELGKYNIRVNTLCPGTILTARTHELYEDRAKKLGITKEEAIKGRIAVVPLRRIGDPKEFGDTIAFLASEKASYITGTTLLVDGGSVKATF